MTSITPFNINVLSTDLVLKAKIAFVLFLAGIFFFAPLNAQDQSTARVDSFIKAEMQKQKIPGIALAIVKNGKISYAKGYGYSNVEHRVPVKVETVFQSGSVGKQFTSAAVMLLVEDGKINLGDKIGVYFPDAPQAWADITVRHLLTHTSGMGDYPDDFDYRRDYTEDDFYKLIRQTPLAFKPGEKWSYSNLGYVTLGIIIRKASGKYFGDFLKERIFTPLDMKTAQIISESDIISNRAAGYRLVNGKLKNQEWVAPSLNSTADGALYLTLDDMAKWDAALYGEKLFKKSSIEQMWAPVRLNDGKTHPYGFGWAVGKVTGSRTVEHGWAWQGFKSHITRYLDERTTVIIFANLSQAGIGRLARGVAKNYSAKLASIPAKAIQDKEPKISAFAKRILEQILDNTISKDLFDTNAREKLYPRLKPFSKRIKPFGKLVKIELLERIERNSLRRYKYRVEFENVKMIYFLVLNQQNRISGFRLLPV